MTTDDAEWSRTKITRRLDEWAGRWTRAKAGGRQADHPLVYSAARAGGIENRRFKRF